MTPFWDPNFSPHVWSIGGPISLCPQGAWTKFKCALRLRSWVPPPILCAIGLALARRATRENDANFGDFGIMTPLDEPVVP